MKVDRYIIDCIYNGIREVFPMDREYGSIIEVGAIHVLDRYIKLQVDFTSYAEKKYPTYEMFFHVVDDNVHHGITFLAYLPFQLKRSFSPQYVIDLNNQELERLQIGRYELKDGCVTYQFTIRIDNYENLPSQMPNIIRNVMVASTYISNKPDLWHLHPE